MSAYEEFGRTFVNLFSDACIILAGITSDVLHQNVHVLTLEAQHFGIHHTEVAAVAVAADGAQRSELGEALRKEWGADVAGVPYLVAWLEVSQILVVPKEWVSLIMPMVFIPQPSFPELSL